MGGATDRKILRRAQRLPTICLPPIGQAAFLLCVLCALLWQFLPRSPSHICLPPEMLLSSFVPFVPSCGNSSAKVQEAAQGESEDARQILQSLRRALVVEDIFLDLEFVAAK